MINKNWIGVILIIRFPQLYPNDIYLTYYLFVNNTLTSTVVEVYARKRMYNFGETNAIFRSKTFFLKLKQLKRIQSAEIWTTL